MSARTRSRPQPRIPNPEHLLRRFLVLQDAVFDPDLPVYVLEHEVVGIAARSLLGVGATPGLKTSETWMFPMYPPVPPSSPLNRRYCPALAGPVTVPSLVNGPSIVAKPLEVSVRDAGSVMPFVELSRAPGSAAANGSAARP